MEATVVSVGKSVLDGALSFAKSMVAEEVALQLGVERDVGFIADELEMMQSFLMTADDEQDQHKVLKTWVKQVRDLAYDVEDNLQDFSVHSDGTPSRWCILCTLWERRGIAKGVKSLKAKVEDVSSRNLRYRLIKDGYAPKRATDVDQATIADTTPFGIEGANAATRKETTILDLGKLIMSEEVALRVIAVWGTSGDLGKTSEIRKAYDNTTAKTRFGCRAWVRLMHPFNALEFLRSIVRQFYENSPEKLGKTQEGTTVGASVLRKIMSMDQIDLVIEEFHNLVNVNSYLIVIDNLSTIVDWDCIRTYFPNMNKKSRIIVSTQQAEVASLCVDQPYEMSELKWVSAEQTLYLFYKKDETSTESSGGGDSSSKTQTDENDTLVASSSNHPESVDGNKDPNSAEGGKNMNIGGSKGKAIHVAGAMLVGRVKEQNEIVELITKNQVNNCSEEEPKSVVTAVWGMGGIGKTSLIKAVYQSPKLAGLFRKYAWVTVKHPFSIDVCLRELAEQLNGGLQEISTKKSLATMGYRDLMNLLSEFLQKNSDCLIVLDDIQFTSEFDSIIQCLRKARCILVTTREGTIAKHCSKEDRYMYELRAMNKDDAFDLFKMKVFKKDEEHDLRSDLTEQAELILQKCHGLPLAISTIGGFLSDKPRTAPEWKKLNDHISAELEINTELQMIKTILMKSYNGLPYHLKSSFLYMSLFPEDHKIRRKRLVRRWVAEGYSSEIRGMTAEEVGDKHFAELVDRSMILPTNRVVHSAGKIGSCQLHDMIREISISMSAEENLVYVLEEGCSMKAQGTIRHLSVSSKWGRDKDVFDSILDLSHVRSLTVFGEWRSYLLSEKMKLLRVLDLEETVGLRNHDLANIGKLRHLRYLSLRGCRGVMLLPDCLGNLRYLQTLDVRDTLIMMLPKTVANLQRLQYLRAGFVRQDMHKDDIYEKLVHKTLDQISGRGICRNWSCFNFCSWLDLSLYFCRPELLHAGLNRDDISMLRTFFMVAGWMHYALHGIRVTRDVVDLKALHTLSVVDVAWGKTTMEVLTRLTQLHKLSVTGVNKENKEDFWSAIHSHNHLRSLSVKVEQTSESRELETNLDGCLGISDNTDVTTDVPADVHANSNGWCPKLGRIFVSRARRSTEVQTQLIPPKGLESLKVEGQLVNVPKWIHELQNLTKLQLCSTRLQLDDVQDIGRLPNLSILRLRSLSFLGKELHFLRYSFPSLVVLELADLPQVQLVYFEGKTMPNLELLQVYSCLSNGVLSGLPHLARLKEVSLTRVHYSLIVRVQNQVKDCPKIHLKVNFGDSL